MSLQILPLLIIFSASIATLLPDTSNEWWHDWLIYNVPINVFFYWLPVFLQNNSYFPYVMTGKNVNIFKHLQGWIHGFLSSRPTKQSCWQDGNGSPNPAWIFWIWCSTDFHLAAASWPFPCDDTTLQYRWLIMLEIQGLNPSHIRSWLSAFNFFFIPVIEKKRYSKNDTSIHWLQQLMLSDITRYRQANSNNLLLHARCQTDELHQDDLSSSSCWCRDGGLL